jgi:uncharacterized heparinase superfamily protein
MRLERLLTMRPAHVAGRARDEMMKRLERLPGWDPNAAEPQANVHRVVDTLKSGLDRHFFAGTLDATAARLVAGRMPADHDALRAAAEELLRGRFHLLGYHGLDFGDPIDWQLDAVSGRRAPLEHWSRLDPLDAERVGDHKVTWELNRHQWLVTLAQAYATTGDERYAAQVAGQLQAWIRANPAGIGINWTSSLELALRLMSWCWAIRLSAASPALDARRLEDVVRSLGVHAVRIERYLSYWYSPNTHLTGEALGLYYAGATLPGLARAERWRTLASSILERELERQVAADGVYFEQSPSYQRYTVEIYLHWLMLAERVGDVLPPLVAERVQSMLDFLLFLRRPDGSMPGIGDADGGWLLPLAPREPDELRPLFSTAAALFGRSDYAWAARGLMPETVWLLGTHGAEAFDALAAAPPARAPSRVFPQGGWAVMRSSWQDDAHHVLFDVGPLGCPASSAHGHADLLAVQASFFGEPLVVDPGTCHYSDERWRNAFRTSQFHSTVTVDGLSQAEPSGPFSWRERPSARLLQWVSTPAYDLCSGEHDAYRRLPDPVGHRRTVFFAKPRRIVIVDELSGADEHLVEVRFQLAPGARIESSGRAVRVVGPRGHAVDIAAVAPVDLATSIHDGELEPPLGWYSRDYGRREPAPQLVLSTRARLPLVIVTVLMPQPCAESQES